MAWVFDEDDGLGVRDPFVTAMDLSVGCDGFTDLLPISPSVARKFPVERRDPMLLAAENSTLQATVKTLERVRDERLAVNASLKSELSEWQVRFQRALVARSANSPT
jgi:hypothetical protein